MTPLQVSCWRGKFLRRTQSGTPPSIIYTRWSSRRYGLGCRAPMPESDIVREQMHGKQIEPSTAHDRRHLWHHRDIYRHIPPGHANKCSQYLCTNLPNCRSYLLIFTKKTECCITMHKHFMWWTIVLEKHEYVLVFDIILQNWTDVSYSS